MLGFAQTHQGFALDPPPFEKGGPKLYYFSTAVTIKEGKSPPARSVPCRRAFL